MSALFPDGCQCAVSVSLRRELATIFGPVQPREGTTWNDAMLARIAQKLIEEYEDGRAFGASE